MKLNTKHKDPVKGKQFHAYYKHYQTGEMMYAADYGYKAWPF